MTCECCGGEPSVGVASIPFIPMSIAWGRKCLDADVVPYWAAVANTAMIGGLERASTEWRDLVRRTLTYFEKPDDQFAADVAADQLEAEVTDSGPVCPDCGGHPEIEPPGPAGSAESGVALMWCPNCEKVVD